MNRTGEPQNHSIVAEAAPPAEAHASATKPSVHGPNAHQEMSGLPAREGNARRGFPDGTNAGNVGWHVSQNAGNPAFRAVRLRTVINGKASGTRAFLRGTGGGRGRGLLDFADRGYHRRDPPIAWLHSRQRRVG